MAGIFAVFLVALLVVFLRPEGRADRFARARSLVSRGVQASRNLFRQGSEAVDRLSADLAADPAQPGSLDGLLGPADPAEAAPTAD